MSSAAALDLHAPTFEQLWSTGRLPPVAGVGCASTPTAGGFYIDWPEGAQWEAVVAEELPGLLAGHFGGDRDQVVVSGSSMGGYGALKLAFRHPARDVVCVAPSPAVFPGDTAAQVPARNRPGCARRAAGVSSSCPATPWPPVCTATSRLIREHEPALFLGVGDHDEFHLDDGVEHLHRLLRELG